MKDYYKILKISNVATLDEIKHSFRILAHKYHPDKSPGTQELFLEIKEAYDVLSDTFKRNEYDRTYESQFSNKRSFDYSSYNLTTDIKSDFDFLLSELNKFSPDKVDNIVLEELKESIDRCRVKLSKVKLTLSHQSDLYLKLSSLIVINSIEISDRIINTILQTLLISPSDKLLRFDNIQRMVGALSWVDSVLQNTINPIADYDMDTQTRERYLLKADFYNELKKTLESKTSNNNSQSNCYVATMIYGNKNHLNVVLLRDYRDQILAKTTYGKIFIKLYYAISPLLVRKTKRNGFAYQLLKFFVERIVKKLKQLNNKND